MGRRKSFLQNTSKRIFLYFESWYDNNCNTLNIRAKNSENIVSKYTSKTMGEQAFTKKYIGFFLTQGKIGVLRCKNAFPKKPPKN